MIDLTNYRHADDIRGTDVVAPTSVALAIRPYAKAEGIRRYGEAPRLYRVKPGEAPRPLDRGRFTAWVHAWTLAVLRNADQTAARGTMGHRRVRETLAILERGRYGSATYLRRVVEAVAESAVELTDAEYRAHLEARARERSAAKTAKDRPAKTAAERKRAERARKRAAEEASAEWFLRAWLGEDNEDRPNVGDRFTPAELHELASAWIGELVNEYEDCMLDERVPVEMRRQDWAERVEDEGFPVVPRVPGPRVFRAVVERVLGAPEKASHARIVHFIIQEHHMFEEIRRETKILREFNTEAERAHYWVERLLAQRERLAGRQVERSSAATGTDGRVIALHDARARRRRA